MAVRRKNCDFCGQPIELRQLGRKTWKPFDPDGQPHDCPGRFENGRPVDPVAVNAVPVTDAPVTVARAARPEPFLGSRFGKMLLVAALGLVAAYVIIPRFFGSGAFPPVPPAGQMPEVPAMSAPPTLATTAQPTKTPRSRPTATALADAAPANTAPLACDLYGNQTWAQAVFDQDPRVHRDLDPDGDGFACEELPYGAVPALWTTRIPPKAEQVQLISTIDGDTIVVRRPNGQTENVRLVGIDTPETGKGTRPLECYGEEATEFTRELFDAADDRVVWLEIDQEDRDRYGRLLRYVWFQDEGQVYMANDAIVRSGYAERYRDTPNRRYYDGFIDGEAFAKRHGYGLWSACA